MVNGRRGRAGTGIAVLAALSAVGVASASSAAGDGSAKRGDEYTIKAKLKRGFPIYKGPDEMTAGGTLTILNKTNPKVTGPHTFSLVTKSEQPRGERERAKCGKASNRKGVCKDIAEAHEMGTTNTANTLNIDPGDTGYWDSSFNGTDFGDSYYTALQGETHTRTLTETPTKLYYQCIIWPRMQGRIKVTPSR